MAARASIKVPGKLGVGCLVLFALPFAGFGVFALVMAARELQAGKWASGAALLLFALVFCGVGFGLMVAAFFGGRKATAQQQLEARHPDEPWLWRDDWARGEIKSSNRNALVFIGLFALFWNAISSIGLLAVFNEAKRNKAIYFALIFPAVGILLLIWAIRQWLGWRRFGEAVLKLNTRPGVIGGPFAGVLITAQPIHRAQEIRLRLVCIERDTSGDNTSERVQWEDDKTLSGEVLQSGEGIPVLFNIPYDCKPTAVLSSSRSVIWRLEASALVPGTDFSRQFEVPIFKTIESRPDAAPIPDPAAAYVKPVQLAPPRGIRIRTAGNGGVDFHFGAARNKGAAFGLTLFTAIWIGAIVLMIKLNAPIGFPIVFGLFGALMLFGVIGMWTGASRVIAHRDSLEVVHWYCFFSWKNLLAAPEVQSIEPKLGMSSGTTTYYDLVAKTSSGKKVKLASSIKGRKESEWLAQEIQNALRRK